MKTKANLIADKFPLHFNCAQTIFSLFAPELGIEEKTALKIASGFGGGMTRAKTCGAVTGAYMVIGLKHGHDSSDPEEKAKTKMLIQKFNKEFEKKHGTLICKELTGYDISTPEGSQAASESGVFQSKCPLFLKTACEIIENEF